MPGRHGAALEFRCFDGLPLCVRPAPGLADGREVTLDELSSAEAMRAFEVDLSVPDGRSIRMLINVAPIRLGDGEVESAVVTLGALLASETARAATARPSILPMAAVRAYQRSPPRSVTSFEASSFAASRRAVSTPSESDCSCPDANRQPRR